MKLSATGESTVSDFATRHHLSKESVQHLLEALQRGGGTMAQFQCAEFGSGQWMRGGMTMVGDMFNHSLKARVDSVLTELAAAMSDPELFVAAATEKAIGESPSHGNWWPSDLGSPSSSGSQNHIRYAIFPTTRRLAIDRGGEVTVYDTGTHQIGGISQQQGSGSKLEFSSQLGSFPAESLPVISGKEKKNAAPEPSASAFKSNPAPDATPDVAATLRKLVDLHSQGLLSDEELAAKRKQVIDRI